jgi:lactate dehydrogenase-like 2-hydroxyacid dehydrogenase
MSDQPEIVVLHRIFAPTLVALEARYTVHKLWLATGRAATLREIAPRTRAAVTTGLLGCDAATMDALPTLEIIASFGAPRASLDFEAAKARGILCTNTPDQITEAVADLALGLMIDVMRGVTRGDRFIRAGLWQKELARPGYEVRGKKCGIVGLGSIGQFVATRVQAFGMPVHYHGPRRKAVPFPYYDNLEALARAVDVLIVCCPLTPETRGLISAPVLDALGAEGFLVNVARGAVVDEAALTRALRDKRIAGAGLDVFWDEPHVPQAFREFDNVVMAPHIGTHTQEVRVERGRKVLANLEAHFAGKAVPYPLARLNRGD